MEKTITLKNETGLHARPAGVFAKAAAGYTCKVQIRFGESTINAKSVMSVMGLGLEKGAQFTLITEGADEEAALERLSLSARAHDRVLRVARTISDLKGDEEIGPEAVAEAIQYRQLDRDAAA